MCSFAWPAVGEGDGERVERGFPPCDPSYLPLAGGVQRADGQVHALERGLLVGEVAAGADGALESRVERFDGVGRADHAPDLHVIVQERYEPFPRVHPQPADRGISRLPLVQHRVAGRRRGGGARRGVDGFDIAFDGVPVLLRRVAERVAQQMHHAGLHDGQRPYRAHRVGQAFEPVADQEEHIVHAPVLQLGEHRQPIACALRGGRRPDAQHVAVALQIHANGHVERAVGDLPVAHLDDGRVDEHGRVHALQRARAPVVHLVHDPGGDVFLFNRKLRF